MEISVAELLFTQGFGTRRICAGLVQRGLVQIDGQTLADAAHPIMVHDGMHYVVQGQLWQYYAKACIVLHKPAGTECSQKPSAWPSVYTLLPTPLRQRPQKRGSMGVQAVGRLDQDTTGLLILTDDGQLIHRMASPKRRVPKVYQVRCRHAVTAQQVQRLLAGVVLDDDPQPVQAAACQPTGTHTLDLTLTAGKYHQVKRMIAAVGNRVEALHRSRIGGFDLPADLAPGHWRWLQTDDIALLQRSS